MIKRIVKIFLFILLIFGIYKGIQIHHDVKQVMQYRSLVREVLAEEDTTANENLILAMIYTETKGREDDVMQASESASGETNTCLLYTSPSPRDVEESRMPSSA